MRVRAHAPRCDRDATEMRPRCDSRSALDGPTNYEQTLNWGRGGRARVKGKAKRGSQGYRTLRSGKKPGFACADLESEWCTMLVVLGPRDGARLVRREHERAEVGSLVIVTAEEPMPAPTIEA
eukprot:6202044-Pleurochrysis_carterae.AAC.1